MSAPANQTEPRHSAPNGSMPAALEHEAAMLSLYLAHPGFYASHPTVKADYYTPEHQIIHAGIGELIADEKPCDLIAITHHLRETKRLDSARGAAYVTEICGLCALPSNADYTLEILREKSRLRAIHATASAVASAALLHGADPEELSERMQQLLTGLAREASTGSGVATMSDLVPAAIERIEARFDGRGKLRGIASGLGLLDRLTAGWQGGQMIVIAAREKEGKSSLARQFVLEAAIGHDVSVAIFSHEMGREEIVDAMIATRARVDQRRIEDGVCSDVDFAKITRAADDLRAANIHIFDESDSSVLQFRANCRRAVKELGCQLIVLDYLQLVGGGGTRKDRSREEDVSEVGRNVKLAAKELNVPIIVLSQLNSEGVTQYARAIQQHLDRLIVIEHENPEAEGDGKAWIKVKLARGGPKGSVPVTWRPSITRFDALAHDQ